MLEEKTSPLECNTEPTSSGVEKEGGLELGLSPRGHLFLYEDVDALETLSAPARSRLLDAFAGSSARGLLLLGACEVQTRLGGGLAFWRDFAASFVRGLCTRADAEVNTQAIPTPPGEVDTAAWLARLPPILGAEYATPEMLETCWGELNGALAEELTASGLDLAAWLARCHSSWHVLGRVCFHLVENKSDPARPFAFMATFADRPPGQLRMVHLPLARALKASQQSGDREALLNLLVPVQHAAERSVWVKGILESGELFHPLALSPMEAYSFLRDVPEFEASGVAVRLPDWWKRRGSRPRVQVSVGAKAPSGLGLKALLDFRMSVGLDGEDLTPEEVETLLNTDQPLVALRGRWVEVDAAQLHQALEHWRRVQGEIGSDGMSLLEGMRLLSGAATPREEGEANDALQQFTRIEAGPWMAELLESLRDPERLGGVDPGPALLAELRPYQQVGLRWLWTLSRLGLGACLADDMGLGKTLQVIALMVLAKRHGEEGPHLLVVPASLISNWQAELERFAPNLRVAIVHGSTGTAVDLNGNLTDLVITSYATLLRTVDLRQRSWSLLVLDEAQAIKNPGSQQTQVVKGLRARAKVALTGTPVENRLSDLWSLFDFLNPGLLGSAREFSRFTRAQASDARGFAPLRALVGPYILRRLKSDKKIISDLPDKSEVKSFCPLSPRQAALYQRNVDELAERLQTTQGMERRGLVLAYLMRFKQICNHPSHWLADGSWAPEDSGKLQRLGDLAEQIQARQEKVLIFTQFQEVIEPLVGFLTPIFGREGLVLHGGTPVKVRRGLVETFQREGGPPFFVLSLKAGGTGLTLTAASHVIHFDRWWNPAVENQATDRAYRIGQHKNVLVHKFITQGTVEEKIDALIESKRSLSTEIMQAGAELNLTELNNEALMKLVSLDLSNLPT